jgi:hypothetical protein
MCVSVKHPIVMECFNWWEMIEFFAGHLAHNLRDIGAFQNDLGQSFDGQEEASDVIRHSALAHLTGIEEQSKSLELKASAHRVYSLKTRIGHCTGEHYISREKLTIDILRVELDELCKQVITELWERFFVYLPPHHVEYADLPPKGKKDVVPLFGHAVHDAFPSARQDIKDAGNCLALDLSTAAVFHLMQVAEHGLRTLAWDRRVRVTKGPIQLTNWEDIIKELENTEKAIQSYPKTLAREAQFEFYHGAMMELKIQECISESRFTYS